MSSISRPKCESPQASAQAALARQLLEEHGWKVIEITKSSQQSTTSATLSPSRSLVTESCTEELRSSSLSTSISSSSTSVLNASPSSTSNQMVVVSSSPSIAAQPCLSPASDRCQTTGLTNGSASGVSASAGVSYQRTKRGISNTESNFSIVNDMQVLVSDVFNVVGADCETDRQKQAKDSFKHTFILPDLNIYPLEFREFLQKELIETSTLVSLEQTGRLNWWYDLKVCQRLLPLATTGDGNCLLHAASLGIWGFHDRRLTLRQALYDMLTSSQYMEAFKRRWKYHQEQINKQSGLIYSEKEWSEEWDNLIKLASPQPRSNSDHNASKRQLQQQQQDTTTQQQQQQQQRQQPLKPSDIFYESLEELHVFVLSHVLGRPIVIAADTFLKDCNGDALAPILFGGIYLPLELSPHSCHHSPLILSYDSAHFSALVPMDHMLDQSDGETTKLPDAIPLVDSSLDLLPIHFFVDPNETTDLPDAASSVGGDQNGDGLRSTHFVNYDAKSFDVINKYLEIKAIPVPYSRRTQQREMPAKANELSQSFSHLSLKLKSGSCNDIARIVNSSSSSSSAAAKSSTLSEECKKEKLSSSYSESSKRTNPSNNNNNNSRAGSEHGGGEEESPSQGSGKQSASSSPIAKARIKLPQMAQNVVKSINTFGRTVKKKIRQSSSSSPFKKSPSVGDRKNSLAPPANDKQKGQLKGASEAVLQQSPRDDVKRIVDGCCGDTRDLAFSHGRQRSGSDDKILSEKSWVMCAELAHTRHPHQDVMMSNYLECAWRRFESMKRGGTDGFLDFGTTDCINDGCDGFGTQETSYLCRECFEKHKREEMELEKNHSDAKLKHRKAGHGVPGRPEVVPGSTLNNPRELNNSGGFAGNEDERKRRATTSRSGNNKDDDDENNNNNSNNNNINGCYNDYSNSIEDPSNKRSLPCRGSPSSTMLQTKNQSGIRPSASFVNQQQQLSHRSSASPRERKSSLSPSPSSYFSNFVATSSALGRVESGPKLPVFPAAVGKRSTASLQSKVAAPSPSPLLRASPSRPAASASLASSSSSLYTSASPSPSAFTTVTRLGDDTRDGFRASSSSGRSGTFMLNSHQHSQPFSKQLQQSPQQQQHAFQQQSLGGKFFPARGEHPDRTRESRRFEENLENELYNMSQCVQRNDSTSTTTSYHRSSSSGGGYREQRDSVLGRYQQYKF